jgi:sugar/nucleoside kinase (ribokinase family)
MTKSYKVVGIGNAIIDILAYVDDEFLKKNNIKKGVMNLISSDRSKELLKEIKISKKVAGGSAANTIVGLSQLGLDTSYIGKVNNDLLGEFFINELNKNHVTFKNLNKIIFNNLATGHCIVLVTPDGERTMNTYLGITEFLSKDDLDIDILNNSEWIYLEGYRYDGVDSQLAFELAINETKKSRGKIALSLSDPFCVDRHRKKFLDIIENGIDLIFCNEKELMSLTEESNLNSALKKCTEYSCEVVCTVAEKGVMIKKEVSWINVPTDRVKIVDTTGAGDLFATGYLYGILNGHDPERSAFFANQCAGQVIQILGCRLDSQKLSDLF